MIHEFSYIRTVTYLCNNMYLFDGVQITLMMISGRISGRIFFSQMSIWHKITLKGGIFRSCNFQGKPCLHPLYKTESNTLRSPFQEDQMVLPEHQLSKLHYGRLCFHWRQGCKNIKRVSTTFECPLCKIDCWNNHLITGSHKKRRQGKKV